MARRSTLKWLAVWGALLATGSGCGDSGCFEQRVSEDCRNGGELAASTDGKCEGDYVPYIAGAFSRVFRPNGTRYLNDHCFARGADGTWHVYGIAHPSLGRPASEHSLLHATADELAGPWTEQLDILKASSRLNESVLWAPHVAQHAPGRWTILYYGGFLNEEEPKRGLRMARSTDLTNWHRVEQSSSPGKRPPGGRDPFLLRIGKRWALYTVGVDDAMRGQIIVTTNADLSNAQGWSEPRAAITDPVPSLGWGNLESPTVLKYGGKYYLFLTRTGPSHSDYERTNVFRSKDPLRFDWQPITELRAHASEIVVESEGQYSITSSGWTAELGEENRGLSIAPLRWARVL